MSTFSGSDLNTDNKSAWDHLYASTPELIWGASPIAFLSEFLPSPASLPPGSVLDAATGEGRNLPLLLRLGRPVTACDSSAAALAKIAPEIAVHMRTLVCDLEAIPLPDRQFAFILLSDVVETLPEPAPVLAELRRLLVPGGLLLTNIPDENDGVAGVDMVRVGAGWLYQGRFFYRFHTQAEAAALIADAGLEIVACSDRAWTEAAHPNFRQNGHRHCSRVFLLRRPC